MTRVVLILLLLASAPAWGQDTRGSLVPEVPITLGDGSSVAVEDLKVGTPVLVWNDGKPASAKVTGIRRQHVDSFILLKAGKAELRAAGSHRVALAGGKLVRLDTVKVGDTVWLWAPDGPQAAAVVSVRLYPANMVAYDLTIEGHLVFVAGGVVVGD